MSAIRSIAVGLIAAAALVLAGTTAVTAATAAPGDAPMTITDTPWCC